MLAAFDFIHSVPFGGWWRRVLDSDVRSVAGRPLASLGEHPAAGDDYDDALTRGRALEALPDLVRWVTTLSLSRLGLMRAVLAQLDGEARDLIDELSANEHLGLDLGGLLRLPRAPTDDWAALAAMLGITPNNASVRKAHVRDRVLKLARSLELVCELGLGACTPLTEAEESDLGTVLPALTGWCSVQQPPATRKFLRELLSRLPAPLEESAARADAQLDRPLGVLSGAATSDPIEDALGISAAEIERQRAYVVDRAHALADALALVFYEAGMPWRGGRR